MSTPEDSGARQPKDAVLTHQTSEPCSENAGAGPAGNDPSAIGVSRVEAFNKVLYQSGKAGKTWLWMLGISVGLTMFAYALDMGITYSIFTTLAASTFGTHSSLAAVNTASQIIRAISKPFIGKLADITSRPTTYVVVLFFYVVGFAVAASASDFASYTVGICFTSVGKSGLDLLSDIIVGDLTPLQWRGFFSACLSLPFVVTVPINGFITDGFIDNWRWGLGMFCILVPVLLLPAIVLLYAMQRRGEKMGMVTMADSKNARMSGAEKTSWFVLMKNGLIDIDIGGLVILGLAFALILLPFTLAEEMKGGWSNARVIAMLVVGFVLLIVFALYERFVSPKPVMSKRVMNNRTFLAAVFIYTFNQMASSVRNTYYSSYVYVVKPWTPYQWTIFLGVTTMGLSLLGPVVGLLQRKTHRYKSLMVFGSFARLVGYGILVQPDGHMVQDTARLLASQLIFCLGAFNVVGARVGSQASVPHEDMASLISLLTLWSTLGSSIGSAISSAIWTREMLPRMRQEMPNVEDSVINSIYSSITTLRTDYDFNDPIRRGSIRAYAYVNGHIATTALSLCFVPLIAGFFMPDFFLGRQQNAVTNTGLDNEVVDVPKRRVEDDKSVSFLRRLANAYYKDS